MLGEFDTWSYGVLWTPGVVKSVNKHFAVSRKHGLRTWDEWTSEPWLRLPSEHETADQLWCSCTELLERHTGF